jgi:hypothetical protein
MSIYDPLKMRLMAITESSLTLSFVEIEKLTGQPLPKSAYEYEAWWSNEDPTKTTHSQSKAWTTVGFDAQVSLERRQVIFRRR